MDTTNKTTGSTTAAKDIKKTGNVSADTSTTAQPAGTTATVSSDTTMMGTSYQKNPLESKISETEKNGPLYKFFIDGLKDMYFAEKHILDALPKMKDAATTEELKEAFEDHYLITQKHVSRLEKVFKTLEEKAEAKKCDAIIGIVKEGESIIKETEEGTMTRDAALIIAAQKVEHYEIATYGGLVALAETMKLYKVADILDTTLQEEEQTDHDLTDIAESHINFEAADEAEDEWDDEDYDDELTHERTQYYR